MGCENQMGSLARATTGVIRKRSEKRNGWLKTMFCNKGAAEISPKSLERQMPPSSFGLGNMEYHAGQFRKREKSKNGGRVGQIIQCGTNAGISIPDGLGELPQNAKSFTPVENGRPRVPLYGKEITPLAKGAASITEIPQMSLSTYTTLFHLLMKPYERTQKTWCCYVSRATTLSIHGGM